MSDCRTCKAFRIYAFRWPELRSSLSLSSTIPLFPQPLFPCSARPSFHPASLLPRSLFHGSRKIRQINESRIERLLAILVPMTIVEGQEIDWLESIVVLTGWLVRLLADWLQTSFCWSVSSSERLLWILWKLTGLLLPFRTPHIS